MNLGYLGTEYRNGEGIVKKNNVITMHTVWRYLAFLKIDKKVARVEDMMQWFDPIFLTETPQSTLKPHFRFIVIRHFLHKLCELPSLTAFR